VGRARGPRGPLAQGKDAENNERVVSLPKRALVVLMNDTDWQGDVRLTVDWEKLGFDPAKATIDNAAFGAPVRREGRSLVVPTTKRDVRLVSIRQY
jgi:hypothetical protein